MSFSLMTANTLNPIKGWSAQSNPLDFRAGIDPTAGALKAGMVVHLNPTGNGLLLPGAHATGMNFILAKASGRFDAEDPDQGNPATDAGNYVTSVTGNYLVFPVTGAYEFVSCAYVTGGTFTQGHTQLTAATSGGNKGLLVGGTLGTNPIVGIVSRKEGVNGYGRSRAISFWCVDRPVYP